MPPCLPCGVEKMKYRAEHLTSKIGLSYWYAPLFTHEQKKLEYHTNPLTSKNGVLPRMHLTVSSDNFFKNYFGHVIRKITHFIEFFGCSLFV
jgi:hypothetical protein